MRNKNRGGIRLAQVLEGQLLAARSKNLDLRRQLHMIHRDKEGGVLPPATIFVARHGERLDYQWVARGEIWQAQADKPWDTPLTRVLFFSRVSDI
jgi:hypothetical protein